MQMGFSMLKAYFYSLIFFIAHIFITKGMEDSSEINNPLQFSQIKTHFDCIKDFKFNDDGSKIVVMGNDSCIAEIWDIDTNKLTCLKDSAPITAVDFLPNSNIIITINKNLRLTYWSIIDGTLKTHDFVGLTSSDNISIPFISCLYSHCFALVFDNKQLQILKFFYSSVNKKSYFIYDLKDTEQLESISSSNDKYVFLRLKNIATNNQNTRSFKMKKNGKVRAAQLIKDYCPSTNTFLVSTTETELCECSFATPEIGSKMERIAILQGKIKSAIYNPEGNQIIVLTETDSPILLTKKNDTWTYTTSLPSNTEIIRQAKNYRVGFRTSDCSTLGLVKST